MGCKVLVRSTAPVLGLCSLVLLGCGSPATSVDAPAGGTVMVDVPPPATAVPAAPGKLVLDPPLVPLPASDAVGARACRVSDVELGPARDVVTAQEHLYPVASAFGPEGGLAAWMLEGGKVALRAIDPTGRPAAPMVEGPAWKGRPLVVALVDGFVLMRMEASRVDVLSVGLDGKPRGAAVSLALPAAAGLLFDVVRTGDHEITAVTERERPDNGPRKGEEVLLTTVTLEGATFRAEQRAVAVRGVFGDTRAFAGTMDGGRALLLAGSSPERLMLVRDGKAAPIELEEIAFDTRPRVEVLPMSGGSSSGYEYGVSAVRRWPRLPFETSEEPSEARFRLADPEWLGLDEVGWTGAVFVMGRLSGASPGTRARMFAIDCKRGG